MIAANVLRLVIGLPCLYLWGMILLCNSWPFVQLAVPAKRNRNVSGVPIFGSLCGFIVVFMIPDDRAGRLLWVWLLAFLPDVVLVPQFIYALLVRPILKRKR